MCVQVEAEGGARNESLPTSAPTAVQRGRSRSRASSSSSVVSVGSKRGKKLTAANAEGEPVARPSRKRRRFFSSDSEDDDPEFRV